jgi:hypothetical protein
MQLNAIALTCCFCRRAGGFCPASLPRLPNEIFVAVISSGLNFGQTAK